MKNAQLRYFASFCMLFSSVAFGHSAMYPDSFKFDDSDEGLPPALFKSLEQGNSAVAASACVGGSANGFPCNKIDFQSFLAKASMGGGSGNLNDIWGWTDPLNGNEIAIVGRIGGTSFVDITDSVNPVFLGYLPSHDGGSDSWRDIKVYNDHAFIVADGGGNRTHGLQVFDLNTLRNISNPGGTLRETTHLGGFGPAHNIAINEDTGYAYIVGSNQCSGGLYMVDITNPTSPSFAGCFSADGYTHDAQCVVYAGPDTTYRGREICVAYNEDTITFVDVSNKSNPVQISREGYSGSRYTHQGWFLNDNHEILIMNDELDEGRNRINTTSYIWNVSDLDNPREIGRYVGPTAATDHNLYTKDNFIFEANYRAGLRILSTDNITNGQLEEVALFDTIPGSNSAQMSGAWSSYPYFESGNVILSDIGSGLFVVAPDWDAINGTPPTPTPTPTPVPGGCFYAATFESGADGWTNGGSSCSTGTFVRGTPTQTTTGGAILQVAGAAVGSGAWFTAANTAIGTDDVDGGTCQSTSPAVNAASANSVDVSLAYFHGQRDAGDDASDGFVVEVLNDGNVVNTLVNIGDVANAAAWTNVSATVANPGSIQIRVRATDGAAGGDIIEGGIDQVLVCPTGPGGPTPTPSPTPTPTPVPTCAVEEGFESGDGGWTNSTASSCSTGAFVTGTPTEQTNGGVVTQVGGANNGSNAYFTAMNTTAGSNDVDGGNCIATSPSYSVGSASTLSLAYFHGQRDAGDDAGDSFNLEFSTDGGNTFSSLASVGDVASNAAWTNASAQIPAGSNVVLRVQCSDGTAGGDLVECGIDDVNICSN